MNPSLKFIIPTFTVRTTVKRNLRSFTGGKERIDVVSRCFLNLYRWEKRLNAKLSMIIYFSHPEEQKMLTIPLESIAQSIDSELDALSVLIEILNKSIVEEKFEQKNFLELLTSIASDHTLIYLTSKGESLSSLQKELLQNNLCFVLGSQDDLTEEQEKILDNLNAIQLSLGEKEYLASHVITIICNYIFLEKNRDKD
ncbi:MAG: hypothetical protein ACTSQE_08830 [Candidatus Heimdallarchaeaceae archaeon]